jgi:hypothetical protein
MSHRRPSEDLGSADIQQSQGKAKADKPVRKVPATSRKAPREKKKAA